MSGKRKMFEWTADAVATLRRCWAEDQAPADIGRLLGITRSAVGGKAHRLGLPVRALRPEYQNARASATASPKRRPVPRLVDMQRRRPSDEPQSPTAALEAIEPAVLPVQPPPPPPPLPLLEAITAPRPVHASRGERSCCWPIGQPGRPGFRFCGQPPLAAKPYCEDHASVAYVAQRLEKRRHAEARAGTTGLRVKIKLE